MTDFPEFIDNREGNTLERALRTYLGSFDEDPTASSNCIPHTVRIATAYFNPSGFARVANILQPVPKVQLLLGTDPSTVPLGERKKLNETTSSFEKRRLQVGSRKMDEALNQERDNLPFSRTSTEALSQLITVLRSGNMEVKRYEKRFLHAKAYLVAPAGGIAGNSDGIIIGSSNLTGAGLTRNLELNIGCDHKSVAVQAHRWFEDLWNDAVPFDLAVIFEDLLVPHEPWYIFIRVLWHLYGKEVEDDIIIDDNLPLTSFQKHGVARALRLIQNMGGVIVADEVGLGKTFIAGEIIQLYSGRRQRVLLICPASLRDTTWKRFLTTYKLFVECLSFEQLANDVQLRDRQRPNADQKHLQRPLGEYQLVIVDEAHNYRNPVTPTRAAVMRRLTFGQRRDLLLLTATPVNNSLWDLYHLIRYFLRQDAHLADRGILSIRERFEKAMREDPSNLNPDILYPIIDATTVKRTRQFVKKHYASDTISGPDGNPQPIEFPIPQAITVRYNLDEQLPGFFDRLEQALDPENESKINFVRYMPESYLLDKDELDDARAHALVGLLRSGLLKRFESSVYAFRKTVEKMVHEHKLFLNALAAGHVVKTAFMKELSADDDAVFEDILGSTEHSSDAALFDTNNLREAVERDQILLQDLVDLTSEIRADNDPKLQTLVKELVKIGMQAETEATTDDDETQKRKVLVFSYFEDTVKWIKDYMGVVLYTHPGLTNYRDRMVVVSGSGELTGVSRQRAIEGFAPISLEAPSGKDQDLFDLLISTDVLAEGVNLQQCRHIINFDMPWNPMRLVQRHGRIDRIGSPHNRVFLRTIFPVNQLDRLLNLEQRILNKLAMAAASIGVVAPIEGAAQGTQVFAETREEIEKLLSEDASIFERGGTVGAAQTGEEYRHSLRKALQEDRENILNLPWKAGSGMVNGKRRGVFFCAVVGKESKFERTYLRFVEANHEWWPDIETGTIEREIGTCLRLIECTNDTPLWCPDVLQERIYEFWEIAQKDIFRDWMWKTDPANLQPAVRPLNHRVATFIRKHKPHGVQEERLTRALDILESPWPRREEIMLRIWFESQEHEGSALSRFMIDQIYESGLEPARPPPPLPPISQDDIELLCWMGVESDTAVS